MSHAETKKPLFGLGRIVATPGALAALHDAGQQPGEFLARHVTGDWGELDDEDKGLNDEAVTDGSRILSAFTLRTGERMWVITDAVNEVGLRYASTILLPEEY